MSEPRFEVVDRDGAVIFTMRRRENAQDEADELNRSGLPEGRPYRVRERPAERLADRPVATVPVHRFGPWL